MEEEEVIVLDYPETMEHLLRESVGLLADFLKYAQKDAFVPVELEIATEDHLNICAKLGWTQ